MTVGHRGSPDEVFHILQDRSKKPHGSTPTPQRRCLFRDLQKKMTPDVVCYLDRSAVTLKVPKFLLESDVRLHCSHMVILFQINLRLECSTGANIVSLWGVMPVCLKCG